MYSRVKHVDTLNWVLFIPRLFVREKLESSRRHQDADFQFSPKVVKTFGSTSCRHPRSASFLPQFPQFRDAKL